jgi:hypothetical protein
MKELFKDIMGIEDVEGVMVFSFDGQLVYDDFLNELSGTLENISWKSFIDSISTVREADIIFENKRLYIRKALTCYLVVTMGLFAPVAMVRLNCDILLPSLKPDMASKGFGSLFKRKK